MLYRIREVLDLVASDGFRAASSKAYAIRVEEIGKAWRWPNAILTALFGMAYFATVMLASLFLRKPRLSADTAALIDRLAATYYYVPESVLFKGIELDAASRLTFAGKGLDLGCGNGFTGTVLKASVGIAELHGVDQVNNLAAPETYASFTVGDARDLPYPDESFDFVFSFGVIDHIPDLEPVLAQAARVLKKGGHLTFAIQTQTFRKSSLWYKTFLRFGKQDLAHAYSDYRDVYDMIHH